MINKVILTGRLTKDIELRKTNNGKSVTSFNLAVDRNYGDKETDFIQTQVWNQSADFLGNYAHKGTMIAVEGRIQTRSYQNQQGQNVYVTEVIADRVEILNQPKDKEEQKQEVPHHTEENEFKNTARIDINSDELPFY